MSKAMRLPVPIEEPRVVDAKVMGRDEMAEYEKRQRDELVQEHREKLRQKMQADLERRGLRPEVASFWSSFGS